MSNCEKHNLIINFVCKKCGIKLCKDCKPIAYMGEIFCIECSEKIDESFIDKKNKAIFIKPIIKKIFFLTVCLFLLCLAIYYSFWKLKPIIIPVDERESVEFYLSLAYDSGKNSKTYERQMNSILRMNQSYRHLLGHIQKGDNAKDNKDYEEAISYYKKVRLMLPDWDYVYIFLAECFINLNDNESAIDYLKQAIELSPEKTKAYTMLGDVYQREGKFDNAILQYSKAMFIDNKNGKYPLALAKLYLESRNISKAIEHRDKAKNLGENTFDIDALIKQFIRKQ